MPYTVADLFSGAGGLSLGFRLAGYKLSFALDADWDAVKTYTHNNPDVPWIAKDARTVSAKEITDVASANAGDFDVIIAGVPCEGYSLLNRRYDPSDPRNYLFMEFLRITKSFMPKAVLIENVPGLSRRENGGFKSEIVRSLSSLGYTVSVTTLDAADYGVPQKRSRIFFVGLLGKEKYEPPPPTHGPEKGRDLLQLAGEQDSPALKPHVNVRDAISDLPPLNPGERVEKYDEPAKTEYQAMMREGARKLYNHEAPKHPKWTVEMIARTRPGEPIYKTFKQRIRLAWENPSPTIPAGGVRPQWFFAHPEQPRGLTVREVARLQSFPDWYAFCGPLIKQRVLVGDAVPPLLARAMAQQLLKFLESL